MAYGPIELLVLRFPGNQFRGEIVPAMEALVENGTVRIIDLLFVQKDANGDLTVIEMTEMDDEDRSAYDPLVDDVGGLISEDDALFFASSLEPNSSAGLLLFENTWAAGFAEAVRNANGEVLINERVPRAVMDELEAAQA